MASDMKSTGAPAAVREKGVRIFTYPKIIFIFPTLIMALICWIGMLFDQDGAAKFNFEQMHRRERQQEAADQKKGAAAANNSILPPSVAAAIAPDPMAFNRRENIFGLLFLAVLFLNLLILAIDFPRFAIFGIVLGGTTLTFFLLWLGVYVDVFKPLVRVLQGVYVVANAEFYFLISLVLLVIYGVVFLTRWLDYWEIMPNEILHHHGPLSDLERYPTLNLKFDKEIPDVFEHLMFGAGRLVLHVADERKAIVLDTVLHVSRKEEALKKLMSRLEVRVTTDQEVAN